MTTPSTAEVRAWARDKGFPVGDRGRLSPDLVAQYVAERGGGPSAPARPPGSARSNPPVSTTRTSTGRRPARGVVRARTPWNWPALEAQGRTSTGGAARDGS
ncbi:MAG TPA: hypothetical protein VNU26_09965 [Mycobacteriales bacterium]|nr:hypothetical protein [Mycobacteriales bacterium]